MIFAVGFNKIKIKPSNDAQWTNVSYVEGFAELFKADYEYYTDYFTSYEAYINNAYIWSNKTQELKQSISDAFDFTIIKPIIEICIGGDLIMHTKLTEEQKKLKKMGILVDVSMFTFSLMGGGGITAGKVVKSLLVEMTTGMSMVGVTFFANAVDLPVGLTMLLMMIVGVLTGTAADKAFDFVENGVDNFIYGLKNSESTYSVKKLQRFAKSIGIRDLPLTYDEILRFCGNRQDLSETLVKSILESYGDEGLSLMDLVKKYNLTSDPQKGSLSIYQTRIWYKWQESLISSNLDYGQSLEDVARQAFEMRNSIRTKARISMANTKWAEFLFKNESNLTFDDLVLKNRARGYEGDELWKKIIQSS